MEKKTILQFFGGIILLIGVIIFAISHRSTSKNDVDINIVEIVTVIKNHRFEPNIIRVESGKKIRFTIHNQDSTVEEFESHDLHREKIIMPNDSINIILAPLVPGKYDFFGDFHQETAQGSLIVN
ncbi:cupredoxin domain-containing protein [Candidatus Tisiphia endosymbiont of Melanophora roralis]|uniref:cupredoxin domain-containing protein n=1 Tax=Candidatus Tisiphia endosymbiont of Melanophora roralis TaxID=3066261 RepID=UPI001E811B9D|nr:MAG: cupredoxin domain-containing protein [Rickettsia endosymbiont of Cimex lectularius]